MAVLDEVLIRLRASRDQLRGLGVVRLGIFGSIARGERRQHSDLDVLVELDRRTFDRYMDLKIFLEDLLEVPVDLGFTDRIKPELRDGVLAEVVEAW